jgi:hypothetical protein
VDELRWVLTHLDERSPTLVIQEIHAKLIAVPAQTSQAPHGKIGGTWMSEQPHDDRPPA